MKASDFRELVRETFLYLLEEDEEFQLEVSDKLQKLGVLSEAKYSNIPDDPDLLENLTLLAEGKSLQMSVGGKKIRSPKLKNKKDSRKWAKTIYEKFGGTWNSSSSQSGNSMLKEGRKGGSDTLEFVNAMIGGNSGTNEDGGSNIRSAASSQNSELLREALKSIPTRMNSAIAFNEDRDSSEDIDMSSILEDTARTTLLNQPASHNQTMMTPPDAASMVVSQKTPDQLFGSDMANGTWAKLAFSDIGK